MSQQYRKRDAGRKACVACWPVEALMLEQVSICRGAEEGRWRVRRSITWWRGDSDRSWQIGHERGGIGSAGACRIVCPPKLLHLVLCRQISRRRPKQTHCQTSPNLEDHRKETSILFNFHAGCCVGPATLSLDRIDMQYIPKKSPDPIGKVMLFSLSVERTVGSQHT